MIKTFESYMKAPKIGDWVIDTAGEDGQIEHINDERKPRILYHIRYSEHCHKTVYVAYLNEIEFIGTKEEVELKIQANKYNL